MPPPSPPGVTKCPKPPPFPPSRQVHSLAVVDPSDGDPVARVEVVCLTPSADGTALFCGLDDGNIALLS